MTIRGFRNIMQALTKDCKCELTNLTFESFDIVTHNRMKGRDTDPTCFVLMIGRIMGSPALIRMSMIDDSVVEDSIVIQTFNTSDKKWEDDWKTFIVESKVNPMEAMEVSHDRFYGYRHNRITKD